jgi:putative hemolysin
MTLMLVLLALALLVGANALYVLGEFSAVSVRRSRVRSLAEEGNARASRLLPHIEEPPALDRYVAACQVGITASSLLLGAFGESQLGPRLAPLLGGLATIVILIGLTGIQMLFGELVPKGVALQHPDRSALTTVVPVTWSLRLFGPLIRLFNGSAMRLLELLGIRHPEHRHIHSPSEIELLVAERATRGDLEPEERRRLRRALHLSSRRAREIMVPRERVTALEVNQPLSAAMEVVTRSRYSRFPVYRGTLDHPIGTLHARDVAAAQLREGAGLAELLRPHGTVSLDAPSDEVLLAMRRGRLQQVLVLDPEGRVAGLVTMTDVLAELFGVMTEAQR